ncbi:MAG: Mbeg1-like protein [[Clostridium] innocuum]
MPNRRIILCGHSKGGNLAVYAGAFCSNRCTESDTCRFTITMDQVFPQKHYKQQAIVLLHSV